MIDCQKTFKFTSYGPVSCHYAGFRSNLFCFPGMLTFASVTASVVYKALLTFPCTSPYYAAGNEHDHDPHPALATGQLPPTVGGAFLRSWLGLLDWQHTDLSRRDFGSTLAASDAERDDVQSRRSRGTSPGSRQRLQPCPWARRRVVCLGALGRGCGLWNRPAGHGTG